MTVADTDVLIDYLNGVDPAFSLVRDEVDRGRLFTTVISRFELLAGATGAKQQARARDLLRALSALPLDAPGADHAAAIARGLASRGQAIGTADTLIAAIVLTHGGVLLTRNRQHFGRVKDLRLVDL